MSKKFIKSTYYHLYLIMHNAQDIVNLLDGALFLLKLEI
jgi:hypothetical protein